MQDDACQPHHRGTILDRTRQRQQESRQVEDGDLRAIGLEQRCSDAGVHGPGQRGRRGMQDLEEPQEGEEPKADREGGENTQETPGLPEVKGNSATKGTAAPVLNDCPDVRRNKDHQAPTTF